jgi:hypothetical protein
VYAVNTAWARAVNGSPFRLYFGRDPNALGDYAATLKDVAVPVEPSFEDIRKRHAEIMYLHDVVWPAQSERQRMLAERRRRAFHTTAKLVHFKPGEFVFVRDMHRGGKLRPRQLGPFRVLHRTRGGA